jgi:hypothetical protein
MTGSGQHRGPRWKWTQIREFRHPQHSEWDLIQWDLEDELVQNPRAVARHLSGEWFYVKTKHAPGLSHLPSMTILFRIAKEPTSDEPGVIEGWEAWYDEDLVTALMATVRSLTNL